MSEEKNKRDDYLKILKKRAETTPEFRKKIQEIRTSTEDE